VTFQSLGGRVDAKVPRAGYILIQPGSQEGERLRACWTMPERPDRHFVPFTWVDACRAHGQELKQIFVYRGQPLAIHVHPSIANVNVRDTLAARIIVGWLVVV
jgi:hypothetical protein